MDQMTVLFARQFVEQLGEVVTFLIPGAIGHEAKSAGSPPFQFRCEGKKLRLVLDVWQIHGLGSGTVAKLRTYFFIYFP